ncbi:MAG: hypothetical protein KA257_13535 [Opitutaceae bacterium]|nr:hypothetical protein [Opitutaceae bacterium]MBP9914026.1 hypothetical protein [Opitutaceae bacterium]
MTARLLSLVFTVSLLLGFAGCAHYRLGSAAPLTFASLYVEPVVVKALIPQAPAIFSSQTRDAFIRDGRVAVVNSAAEADATLSIVVKSYEREVGTVRAGDTGLARKFIITLRAEATLHDNRAGQDLFVRRPLVLQREVFTDSGQNQAEYQLLPLLAQDLADKLKHATLDVW